MEKVSVIVPVYNAEKFIDECIDSIIKQTYSNVEIILLNDGSTDFSLAKCKHWAKQDQRIIVHSQQNQGAAVARKKAVLMASGKWVCFVDADDWVDPEYVESLICESNNVDVVFSPLRKEHFSGKKVYSQIEYFRLLLERKIHLGPINKLIKRELLDESVFYYPRNLRQGEDWCMNVRLANKITKAKQILSCNYHYRCNSTSLTHVKVASLKDRFQESQQIRNGINKIYRKKLRKSILVMYIRLFFLFLQQKIAIRTRIKGFLFFLKEK